MQSVSSNSWDVIVVGAGAAGLMAAASSAERGYRTLLLEKNKKLGVKILMSGGTRCNITHNCGVREIVAAFGRQGRFLHSALAELPPQEVIRLIESQGVATKVESTGKIFPVSNRAIDVRDALVGLARNAGAAIANEQPVRNLEKTETGFTVQTDRDSFSCTQMIVTTGGRSYPGCGTTGDGYQWARQLGHSIVPTVPALVPILNNCPWANELKGITIENAVVEIWQPEQPSNPEIEYSKSERKKLKARSLVQREGSFLFTHWGFSGPAVLDVSREVARHNRRKSLELVCDFFPTQSVEQIAQALMEKKSNAAKQQTVNLLKDFFPGRLAESLVRSSQAHLPSRNADLSKSHLAAVVEQVKRSRFAINGTLGFEKAEVTAGGIELNEVDSKSMQSKLVEGLFFAGEVLDLDGYIGGFNFQSAFSTGWLAGRSVGG